MPDIIDQSPAEKRLRKVLLEHQAEPQSATARRNVTLETATLAGGRRVPLEAQPQPVSEELRQRVEQGTPSALTGEILHVPPVEKPPREKGFIERAATGFGVGERALGVLGRGAELAFRPVQAVETLLLSALGELTEVPGLTNVEMNEAVRKARTGNPTAVRDYLGKLIQIHEGQSETVKGLGSLLSLPLFFPGQFVRGAEALRTAQAATEAARTGAAGALRLEQRLGQAGGVRLPAGGREVRLTPELEAALRAIPAERRAAQIRAIETGSLSAEEKAARIKILQEGPPPPAAPRAAAPAAGVTKKPSLDATLRDLEASRAARAQQAIIAKGKAAYIRDGLKAAEEEAKALGIPLDRAFQRRQLGGEYDKLVAGGVPPIAVPAARRPPRAAEAPPAAPRIVRREAGARAVPLEPLKPPPAQPGVEAGVGPPGGRLPSGREIGGPGRAKPPPPRDPYGMMLSSLKPEREPFLSKFRRGLPEQLYDRNFPLKELEKVTGVPARKSAQVVPGAASAGEDIVRRFYAPIVKPVEKDLPFLEQYMVLRRMEDILARNPHAQLPGGLANEAERLVALQALARKVGAERFAKIEQAAVDLWRANDEQVLRPWLDDGIITPDMYRAMKADHPHYIPFQRADFTETIHSSISARPEANLSTTGIRKMGLEGSERTLANPLQRLLQEPIKAKTIIFRNRAARSIVRALEQLQRQTGEEVVRYIDPKREMNIVQRVTGQQIPRLKKGEISQQWDTISFFENGVKNRVEVPSVYGRVAKGLEAEPDNVALKVARIFNAPLRYGATTYNPFFLPVNVVRDAMAAMFREKLFPFGPDYWAGVWSAIRKNATFSEASQSGALLSGVVENMNPTRALKAPLGGITVRNPWEAVTLPFRLVEEANIIAERGVRLATFRKLRAEGVSQLEAAVRTRDATVDFAKSGHAMRVINQVIPFTNAAVQGQANILRSIRDHPVRSAIFGAMFISGAIMERVNNMRFETSQMIPDYEYTRNWVIQFGEGERSDGSKFPIYVKIPKGEIAAMFTFPAEAIFHLARQSEDRSAVELLLSQGLEISRALSPIEIGGVTGLLPPFLETGVGVQTGVDPFTGFPIVPRREEGLPPEQQFGAETSQTAIQIGRLFKVSPRLVDFVLKDVAAGAGETINWLLSMGLEALGIDSAIFGEEDPEREPAPTGIERLTRERVPGVTRFVGTRDTQLERRGYDNLADAVVDTNRAFSNLPDVTRLGIRFGQVGNSIEGVALTPQQQAQYQEMAGREAIALIEVLTAGPKWQVFSDERKERAIRQQMDLARARARWKMLRLIRQQEQPQPMPSGAPAEQPARETPRRNITLEEIGVR